MSEFMTQCRLVKDGVTTMGWIEAPAAKAGNRVELKGEEGLWLVEAVYDTRETKWIKEKERLDRNSLPSVTTTR